MNQKKIDSWEREDYFWKAGWILIAVFGALLWIVKSLEIDLSVFAKPCLLHTLFGWYCPGCGGTRAVLFFFQGHFLRSLYYYPMVPYVLGLFLWFMVSHTLRHLTKGKIAGLKYRDEYVTAALLLFFVGWIGKNICLALGIRIIP